MIEGQYILLESTAAKEITLYEPTISTSTTPEPVFDTDTSLVD